MAEALEHQRLLTERAMAAAELSALDKLGVDIDLRVVDTQVFARRLTDAEARRSQAEAAAAAADEAIEELTRRLAAATKRADSETGRATAALGLVEAARSQAAMAERLREVAEADAASIAAGRISVGAAAHEAAERAAAAEMAQAAAEASVRSMTQALHGAEGRATEALAAQEASDGRAAAAEMARQQAKEEAADARRREQPRAHAALPPSAPPRCDRLVGLARRRRPGASDLCAPNATSGPFEPAGPADPPAAQRAWGTPGPRPRRLQPTDPSVPAEGRFGSETDRPPGQHTDRARGLSQ
jgi:hypothetical protein